LTALIQNIVLTASIKIFWIRSLEMQNPLDSIGHGQSGSCTTPHMTADLCQVAALSIAYLLVMKD
jgi:hypothetical protein